MVAFDEVLRIDLIRYTNRKVSRWNIVRTFFAKAGFRALVLYRFGHYFYANKLGFLASFCQRLMHHLCSCHIHPAAKIGTGFLIAHVGGIVVGAGTIIGNNCDIRQNVTFGGNFNKMNEEGRTQPLLEDSVSVGAGACVLGPVTIGTQSIIGANSVVTRDVPAGKIAFGVPAKVIKDIWAEKSGRKL
jgi:serine O-acetyltransferase